MGSAQEQAKFWGKDARGWAYSFEPHFKPLWTIMQDRLGVRASTNYLDVGCGAGGACVFAHGRGAKVTGLDVTPDLIAIAKMRLPEGRFDTGDIEHLPYDDGEFDAVFAANVIPFATDARIAVSELKRVCASKGRIAIGAWTARHQQKILAEARNSLIGGPPGLEHTDLAEPGRLEELVATCGLRIISDEEVFCPFEYEDFDALWRAQRSAGSAQAVIARVGEEKVREKIREAVKSLEFVDGSIRLDNWLRCVCLE